jgi:plasmid stabilization system protein ParE
MIYRVVITPEAEADLRTAYRYIRSYAPDAARDWIKRARQSARTLAHRPERCPLSPESASLDEPIRELLFGTGNRGTYRFLFVVFDRSVYVVHVRHGSMLPLSPSGEQCQRHRRPAHYATLRSG